MTSRWLVFLLLLALGACAPQTPTTGTRIRLSDLRPLPEPNAAEIVPLRVSVAAVVSPQGTLESYQLLLDYLSARLDRPVELVQRQTYAETNALIEDNVVDIAFVCTSAYIWGHDAFGMELLAAPQVNGKTSYQSALIVPITSDIRSLEDLQGKVFAFTDPDSFSGRVYPTYLVNSLGHSPETFFARTFFTYSHDDAIRAVSSGIADGAAVDSLVLDFALERDPDLAERVRVIFRSPEFGIPPVVINPESRPQLKAMLQELLLDMPNDPLGRDALTALGVDEFVLATDSDYDSARSISQRVTLVNP